MIGKIESSFREAVHKIPYKHYGNYPMFQWRVSENINKEMENIIPSVFHSKYTRPAVKTFLGYNVDVDCSLKENEYYIYDNVNQAIVTRQFIQ